MTKHTPGPWKVAPDGYRIQTSEYAEDFEIASCDNGLTTPHDQGEIEANAEFIVRACNAHEDLLEACKAVLRWWDNGPKGREYDGINANQLRRAIAKAGGGVK